MSNRETDTALDGGETQDVLSVFGQGEDDKLAEVSPADRLNRLLDQFVYAPLRIAWSDWRTRIGGAIVLFWILVGTVGVVIVPEPTLNEGPRYLGAFQNFGFPLGTDNMGQSVGKQIIHATPAMLKMGLAGILFSAGVGVTVGLTAGYKGGRVDSVLMTLTDIVLTIPGLPVIIVIAAIWPPNDPFIVGMIIAIDSWPGLARQLRAQVMTIREESYIESARTMGVSTTAILQRDIIPQMAPFILINAAGAATAVIGASVGLYFLGILPFTTLNWGMMMNLAHQIGGALANPGRAGHWLFFPAIALASLGFGLTLLSQGMDRVFNPRLRARNADTLSDEDVDDGGDDTGTVSMTRTQK